MYHVEIKQPYIAVKSSHLHEKHTVILDEKTAIFHQVFIKKTKRLRNRLIINEI